MQSVPYEAECFLKMIHFLEAKEKLPKNEDIQEKCKLKKIMATSPQRPLRLDRSRRQQRYTWHSFEQQRKSDRYSCFEKLSHKCTFHAPLTYPSLTGPTLAS